MFKRAAAWLYEKIDGIFLNGILRPSYVLAVDTGWAARTWRFWFWAAGIAVFAYVFFSIAGWFPGTMLANFADFQFATIVQIITLSLIIFVPLMVYGQKPENWTVAAAIFYSASYAVANLYNIAYAAVPPWPQEIIEAMDALGVPGSPHGFAVRLYQFGTLVIAAGYAGTTFFALRHQSLRVRMNWLVVWVAESYAVLEYLGCKVFRDPLGTGDVYLAGRWGVEVLRSSCGREFGELTPWLAPIITGVFLIWVNARKRGV